MKKSDIEVLEVKKSIFGGFRIVGLIRLKRGGRKVFQKTLPAFKCRIVVDEAQCHVVYGFINVKLIELPESLFNNSLTTSNAHVNPFDFI